ncbi:hypothetical protein [Actinokineospora spheciospongiae]|uniref:hypothetical protein n=1 Tax=Actinokineospora spheciospongiae TaxID=909613 RepID=UPI0007C6DBE2|nr:hypothetical protein [Actinokineospora spheciospongiae]
MSPESRRSSQHGGSATLVRQTKDVQTAVVSALLRYIELTVKMREFEDLFSSQVVSTAAELFMVREQRKRLEREYRRIQQKVAQGDYDTADEIKAEVDEALRSFDGVAAPAGSEAAPEPGGYEGERIDAATKARIVREFKRTVLPNVHSDTSEAEFSEFEVAYSAYRSRDYTLMEALVIQYRGEIGLEEDGQPLTLRQLQTRLADYRAAQKRLDERLRSLEQDVTSAEVSAPDQARKRMEEQRERFLHAIAEEADKVRDLQDLLRDLAATARNRSRGES